MQLCGVIAECGNHALGSVESAKEQIRVARECGATYAKFQAIDTEAFTGGSMTPAFYELCDLGYARYLELVAYGDELGIPVFFSVFGPKYAALARIKGKPYKIAGSQFEKMPLPELAAWNEQTEHPVVVSVPHTEESVIRERREALSHMSVMYVVNYLPDQVTFFSLERLRRILNQPIGYSCHAAGVDHAIEAIAEHGAPLVEKHFNLWGDQTYDGRIYRDSLHAASPKELERLCSFYHAHSR